jgi:hypothetical protein
VAQVTQQSRCACGNIALTSLSKEGITIHKCYDCMRKPPSKREKDDRLLRQLGLIA